MYQIGVVVLNYVNYSETIKCVDSLLHQKDVKLYIVIVDNGSGNESLSEIKKYFSDADNVCVLELANNIGFARGMNAGIKHLRALGLSDIFIANSDLVFESKSIINQLVESGQFSDQTVGVINPTIHNMDGSVTTRLYFKRHYLRLRMIKTFIPFIEKAKRQVIKSLKKKTGYDDNGTAVGVFSEKTVTHSDEYVVIGSGYLLTKRFFDFYNGLYPGTFLYHEEYALMLLLDTAGLKTSLVNTDVIFHKHGASTTGSIKRYADESRRSVIRLILTPKALIRKKYGIKK